MATMTVWKFDQADEAGEVLDELGSLQKQGLIQVLDGAVVSWPEGAKKPKTRQLHNLSGAGALTGGFWGMLFGLLFLAPLFGFVIGAAAGGAAGALTDIGIDDDFIKQVRDKITPGTSALFLLSEGAVRDRIAEHFSGRDFELIHTNLSSEEEAKLREVFSE